MAERGSPSYERQNTEDVTDLPLKLPVSAIYEHFQCPICMSRIENASITPCGHRYCFKCIEEWINRRHECACCKAKINVDELISDHGFDALIRVVREERVKAEKEYYKQLVDAATNAPFEDQTKEKMGSPLEAVLHKHLKQSLGLHESYHQQLILDYQRGMAKAAQEKHLQADRAMREFPHDPDHPRRVARLAEAEERFEARRNLLGEELERVEKLLAAAYDRYLTEFLPSPSTVPLTVKLSVPERGFIVTEVLLKPDDSMGVVLKKLRGLMEEKGMKIVEFPACDEFEISIISPFAPVDEDDSSDAYCGDGSLDDDESCGKEGPRMSLTNQVLQPDCRPVLEFGIKPGTELRFKGKIVLEGEAPKFCFAATFTSGQSLAMDYFTCKQCNFNWVCKPCSECCHRGMCVVYFTLTVGELGQI